MVAAEGRRDVAPQRLDLLAGVSIMSQIVMVHFVCVRMAHTAPERSILAAIEGTDEFRLTDRILRIIESKTSAKAAGLYVIADIR